MRLLQGAMEVGIVESKHADAQQDLEMAGEEALKNEDPLMIIGFLGPHVYVVKKYVFMFFRRYVFSDNCQFSE
jgi:hypothetical protein